MIHNNFNADEKILRWPEKIDRSFNAHKTLIVTELDLTNRCNNKCPCCCGVNENRAELSKEQIDRIVESLAEIENKGVIMSGGGEPLISPHFEYAVRRLKSCGMKLGLNSNGLALDEEKIKIILNNFEYFRISLDAATPELYKATHGMSESSFYKVIENCRRFVELKDRLNSAVSFGIGFLTSEETRSEMETFVKLCKDIGADFAQFRPFTGDTTDITAEYTRLKKEYETKDFFVKASLQKYREMRNEEKRNYQKCRGMYFSTVVTADAKVFACLHYRQNPGYFLGDLNNQTLSDIFQSARMRSVYEQIDCAQCPTLCRNDVFNRILHSLSLSINHSEFL